MGSRRRRSGASASRRAGSSWPRSCRCRACTRTSLACSTRRRRGSGPTWRARLRRRGGRAASPRQTSSRLSRPRSVHGWSRSLCHGTPPPSTRRPSCHRTAARRPRASSTERTRRGVEAAPWAPQERGLCAPGSRSRCGLAPACLPLLALAPLPRDICPMTPRDVTAGPTRRGDEFCVFSRGARWRVPAAPRASFCVYLFPHDHAVVCNSPRTQRYMTDVRVHCAGRHVSGALLWFR
mmetsp:Transcript_7011/g.21065  ORF Transcript_7011/g.21065 Transcript_7011/m.21065 type:complete len:237 (+) Transcript_7011:550-1260(+)